MLWAQYAQGGLHPEGQPTFHWRVRVIRSNRGILLNVPSEEMNASSEFKKITFTSRGCRKSFTHPLHWFQGKSNIWVTRNSNWTMDGLNEGWIHGQEKLGEGAERMSEKRNAKENRSLVWQTPTVLVRANAAGNVFLLWSCYGGCILHWCKVLLTTDMWCTSIKHS
jgi:hypothetical protein